MQFDEVKKLSPITLKSLRDFIMDNGITDQDTIAITESAFDELALEYRKEYQEPIKTPFYLLGVLITPAPNMTLLSGRIRIIYDDPRPEPSAGPVVSNDQVYRCGYCGLIVDHRGYEVSDGERGAAIKRIEKYGNTIVERVHGRCCVDKY